jgi:hypothetical protein
LFALIQFESKIIYRNSWLAAVEHFDFLIF